MNTHVNMEGRMKKVLLAVAIMTGMAVGVPCVQAGVDGGKIVNTTCTGCHTKDRICAEIGKPEAFWKGITDMMISNGASLTAEEQATVVACLGKSDPQCLAACGK
jgi:hypothetical protein